MRALDIEITGNGSTSTSEVSVAVQAETVVQQNNVADVSNQIDESANTGDNSASGNTGGDLAIVTGDVEVVTIVENSLNASEVEVGCCSGDVDVSISDNGSGSVNTINVDSVNNTTTSTNQEADIINSIQGTANTGNNVANNNTNSSVSIKTGDIDVRNGVVNGPINSSFVESSGGVSGMSIVIKNNGEDSINNIAIDLQNNSDVFVNTSSEIENYALWNANTGGNEASNNTGSDAYIETGDITIDTFIENIANIGGVEIDCCGYGDISDPYDPDDSGDPSDPGDPQDPGGSGGESNDDSNNSSDSGGVLLSEAASTEAGVGVFGLSDTSSLPIGSPYFWLGLTMIAIGGKLVTDVVLPKTSTQTQQGDD